MQGTRNKQLLSRIASHPSFQEKESIFIKELVKENDVIKLVGIKKRYGMTEALRGIDLEIEGGEFVAIMGPSGSGKSTLLRIIGLLEKPDEGRYILKGKDITSMKEKEKDLLRRNFFGFVFQQFLLVPYLTAIENVYIPLMISGVSLKEGLEKAKEMLEKLGLGHRLNHFPNQLSGGEQQRVAIARALINNPEVILADEPTGNLDSKTSKEVMKIFKKLHKEGKTIVMVTHDEEVASYAERIVRIRDGKIWEGK